MELLSILDSKGAMMKEGFINLIFLSVILMKLSKDLKDTFVMKEYIQERHSSQHVLIIKM